MIRASEQAVQRGLRAAAQGHGSWRPAAASSRLEAAREHVEAGDDGLLAIFGRLDGAGEDEEQPLDGVDEGGPAGDVVGLVGDVFTGRSAAPQLLAQPAACLDRSKKQPLHGLFEASFLSERLKMAQDVPLGLDQVAHCGHESRDPLTRKRRHRAKLGSWSALRVLCSLRGLKKRQST